jgi:hypothetical protein
LVSSFQKFQTLKQTEKKTKNEKLREDVSQVSNSEANILRFMLLTQLSA